MTVGGVKQRRKIFREDYNPKSSQRLGKNDQSHLRKGTEKNEEEFKKI